MTSQMVPRTAAARRAMKMRMAITASGAAALAGAGAFLLPAAASAHSTTHTLKFVSVQKNTAEFTKTTAGVQDTEINKAGKAIGFDDLYLQATSATTAAANVTIDITGGFLYGTFSVNFNTGAVTNGKVTGGTGAFKGATGTITGKTLNKAGTKHLVTITYHT